VSIRDKSAIEKHFEVTAFGQSADFDVNDRAKWKLKRDGDLLPASFLRGMAVPPAIERSVTRDLSVYACPL